MKKVKLSIKNCMDCSYHKVQKDPDPYDWFCDDDCAVVCTKMNNDKNNPESKWASDNQPFKIVTSACRPYNLRKESKMPSWCPLNKNK